MSFLEQQIKSSTCGRPDILQLSRNVYCPFYLPITMSHWDDQSIIEQLNAGIIFFYFFPDWTSVTWILGSAPQHKHGEFPGSNCYCTALKTLQKTFVSDEKSLLYVETLYWKTSYKLQQEKLTICYIEALFTPKRLTLLLV